MKRIIQGSMQWGILSLLLLLVSVACVSMQSIATLENDLIQFEHGYNTILLIDIEIQDHSLFLQTCENPSLWEFYRGNTSNENRMAQYTFPSVWRSLKDMSILNQTLVLEAIAGTHKISTISFPFNNEVIPFEIFKQFEVFPESINYLGKIKIRVDEDRNYQTIVETDESRQQKTLIDFEQNNPILYKRYEDKVNIVQTQSIAEIAW